ncbi:MAG: diaminopimelate epimerase [Acidimicrobiales bacterium]
MHLTKHHGLGNDFCVAFVDAVPAQAADLARAICHRTRGVGADGLIFATSSTAVGIDVVMHLFNADGSAAAISGNGIRCLAQAVWARHGEAQPGTGRLSIESGGRLYGLDLVSWAPPEAAIAVDMGPVTIDAEPAPVRELVRPEVGVVAASTASVGNPHLVIAVDELSAVDVATDGPAIEAHWLPGGINVHFMVVTGPDAIELIHWERGAGITDACGSGASAAATVAHRWGLVGERVAVTMPGGRAEVLVGEHATLIGPAVHIADIDIDPQIHGVQAIDPIAVLDTAGADRG